MILPPSAATAPVAAWQPRWTPRSWLTRLVWSLGLFLFAVLLLFAITSAGLSIVLLIGALLGAWVLVTWFSPMSALLALVIIGSAHQFLMLLIFHFTGSGLAVRAAQLWKEIVISVLLIKVVSLAFQRGRAPKIYLLDLAIFLFLAYGAFYLVYPSSVEDSSLLSLIFGLRADAFFFLAYFIGRGIPLSVRQLRSILVWFFVLLVIIGLIAGVQFAFPGATNAFFDGLDYQTYMTMQGADGSASFAIRQNQLLGGLLLPRASSLLLSDLGLAFYGLLAGPLAAAALFSFPGTRQRVFLSLMLLLSLASTVLTVTRSAIIALVPVLGAMILRSGAIMWGVLIAIECGVGLLTGLRVVNINLAQLQFLFSLDESSAVGHLNALDLSLAVLREQPFGRGLGTAGQIAQRFTPTGGITNESWYLQVATEMGIPAAILFACILVGFGIVAARNYGRVSNPWLKMLCLGMLGSTLGYAIVSATLHAWEALTIANLFWLFAGLVVRIDTITDDTPTSPRVGVRPPEPGPGASRSLA